MIAGIPSGGQPEIEAFRHEPTKLENFPPGPGKQVVFVLEGGPGRHKRHDLDLGPEAELQILSVRLCKESNRVFLTSGLEERCGDNQITQPPELHD